MPRRRIPGSGVRLRSASVEKAMRRKERERGGAGRRLLYLYVEKFPFVDPPQKAQSLPISRGRSAPRPSLDLGKAKSRTFRLDDTGSRTIYAPLMLVESHHAIESQVYCAINGSFSF